VGNLEAVRDFSDVRDVTAAYALLLERGERGGVYNVASGVGRRLGAVLDSLLARARRPVRVEVEPARFRALEPGRESLVGDPRRLEALGWRPAHAFEETLGDLLDAWRAVA
jgi:GDP-4-dehydro-6-deoxy-D-mannose reductase